MPVNGLIWQAEELELKCRSAGSFSGDENQGCGLLHTTAKTVRSIEQAHKLKIAKRVEIHGIGGGFFTASPASISSL